ncbi:hypothetical protein BHE90_000802 [Fusarium euwallaceae]|uniref:Uncharacterized protein n=2 Tax=Fusarium solani species complex TaxID=232080 RepID=A0A3M2SGS1_9HYPO|nr:hypothetical protein CDV36_003541 [Fusarium kuroshium]RTE84759.1 hypothetical protein BHE90_000802 [Fusarium euwallaceae]
MVGISDWELSSLESLDLSHKPCQSCDTQEDASLVRSAAKISGTQTSPKQDQRASTHSVQYCSLNDVASKCLSDEPVSCDGASISNETYQSRRWALVGHFTLFHLPAVAVTFTLLCLYAIEFHWPYGHPTAEELAVLQFAAKGHEALILISLTDVLLCRISYGLLNGNVGVPLGFISSPFYLGSPIRYLFSSELWSAIRHSVTRRLFPKTTGLIIIIAALLCIGANPLSAIAMIPRETWRGFPKADPGNSLETVCYVDQKLYEFDLDSQHVPELHYSTKTSNCTNARCPPSRRQLDFLADIMYPSQFDDPGSLEKYRLQNVTYTYYDASSTTRPLSLAVIKNSQKKSDQLLYDPRYGDLAVATCPMAFLANYFDSGGGMKDVSSDSPQWLIETKQMAVNGAIRKWKQPLVFVGCHAEQLQENVVSMNFGSEFLNETVTLDAERNRDLRELVKEITGPSVTSGFRLSALGTNISAPVSGSILFASHGTVIVPDGEAVEFIDVSLCLISARWVESDVWIESVTSGIVQTHLDTSIEEFLDHLGDSSPITPLIKMRQGWLDGISTRIDTVSDSAYQLILSYCLDEGSFLQNCLSLALSAHITDALAQPGSFDGMSIANVAEPSNGEITLIDHSASGKAFTYTFKNSRTIPLAFSALLLHVFIVLVHLAFACYSRYPYYKTSWGTFGEMLILALRSRPEREESNTEAEAAVSQMWRKVATV